MSIGARCPLTPDDTKPASEALEEWARGWRGQVKPNRQLPNRIAIPAPPAVDFGDSAGAMATDVDRSARELSDYVDVVEYTQAKSVYCYWFGWYVETGQGVPDREEFPGFLLRYGFGRVLRNPPSKQFTDAVELFRGSIKRAQNSIEAVANGATAAVCSLPSRG